MNVTGIIFANDATMGDLTSKRTMASLPFGGRYRQIDFHLSNMACAGIRNIGIISRYNYQSLMNHVGDAEEWGLELGEGGLEFLTPYAMSTTDRYRGKLENLYFAMDFLEYGLGNEDEYVVLSDSAVLCNMDLTKILAAHIESGKDITIVAKAGIADGRKQLDLAVKLDDKGQISDIAVDYVAGPEHLASMDTFIMSKTFLVHQVRELVARNLCHMDRDLVLGLWQKGVASLNVYPFQGVALFNESIEEYFRNSLSLLDKQIRHDLFGRCHPVYTKVRDRVPSYYGEECEIENCLLADGCFLEGEAEDSILFRDVKICQGAQVEKSLIMNDTVIGEGARVEYVILDKNVTVRPGARLVGTPHDPIIIKRGETV